VKARAILLQIAALELDNKTAWEPAAARQGKPAAKMQDRLSQTRRRVLVAEDQALIAMMIAHELEEAGYEVVGPFTTCADASDWISHDTPELAILDVQLKDGPCTELATELQKRGVRFAVFSGGKQVHGPSAFASVPWFEKPSELSKILASFASDDARST
jgi:CheY-like chemotaxis protein